MLKNDFNWSERRLPMTYLFYDPSLKEGSLMNAQAFDASSNEESEQDEDNDEESWVDDKAEVCLCLCVRAF